MVICASSTCLITRAYPYRQPPFLITPLLRSTHRAPPFCLWTTPYQSRSLSKPMTRHLRHRLHHFLPLLCVPAPTTSCLFLMPPLSPLPPTQDTFTHTDANLLPNLTIFQGPPHMAGTLFPSLTRTVDALFPILLFSKALHILLSSWHHRFL